MSEHTKNRFMKDLGFSEILGKKFIDNALLCSALQIQVSCRHQNNSEKWTANTI